MVSLLERCNPSLPRNDATPGAPPTNLDAYTLMERLHPPRVLTVVAKDWRFIIDGREAAASATSSTSTSPPVGVALRLDIPTAPVTLSLSADCGGDVHGRWIAGSYEETLAVAEAGVFAVILRSGSRSVNKSNRSSC